MDTVLRSRRSLAMALLLPSILVSQVSLASVYSSNAPVSNGAISSDPTVEIEKSCRQKAKDIAVATYNSCFSDEKTAQVEKLKNDYHTKLKALKAFYEAEIKRLSDIKADLKEQHKNNEKNEQKEKEEAKKDVAVMGVADKVETLAGQQSPQLKEEAIAVKAQDAPLENNVNKKSTQATQQVVAPSVAPVDKSTEPTSEVAKDLQQKKSETPVVVPAQKPTETVSEPLPVKQNKKTKVASKNAPKTVVEKKIVSKPILKKQNEKVVSQVGDEKIVLKKDEKIKSNNKISSKISAKKDAATAYVNSVKNKKTKKEMNSEDGMKNTKLDAIKSSDNKDKETVVVSVPPTEADLNSDPAEHGMTVQLKPAPKIKAISEESPADSTDLPEPIPVEGSNSGSAW